MKSKKNKEILPWSILIIIVSMVLYVFIIDPLLDFIYLRKDFAYAISTSVSQGPVRSTGGDVKYTFHINGTSYSGFSTLSLRRDGTKYFIKFYPKNPERNKPTTVVATSEDIKNMPPGGYKELPHE